MSYHDAPGLGRRLVRLPGQLLLALVNATALLVIEGLQGLPKEPNVGLLASETR